MATAEYRSAGKTFSMARWAMAWPSVARRSPAITMPSAKRRATTVVPWRNSCGADGAGHAGRRAPPPVMAGGIGTRSRRMSPAKSGPGSSVVENSGRRHRGYSPPFWT